MEKKNLWWIIVLVLGILITGGFFLSKIEIKNLNCSIFHRDNCNKYCVSNHDCKFSCGCGCIQVNETCSFKKQMLFGDVMISPSCDATSCACGNNSCFENNSPS